MAEPVSTSASGFAIWKIALGISGLFGGLAIFSFWQPERLKRYGTLASVAIISGVSTGASMTLGGVIAMYFGLDRNSIDVALGLGAPIGACSIFTFLAIANFARKREQSDVLEIIEEVRISAASPSKPAPRKVAPRKTAPVKKPIAKKATKK